MANCSGNHKFFVAEVIGVEDAGKVFLIYICTDCGEANAKEFRVSEPGQSIRLMMEEKQKGK